MKTLLLLLILPLFLISTPRLSETEINHEELVERQNIFHKRLSDTPYTGKQLSYHGNGQLHREWSYNNRLEFYSYDMHYNGLD